MISSFKISNFKCFESVEIPLGLITLLCGVNGGGKSSVIQAMLLHSIASRAGDSESALNGPFGLALGDYDLLLNRNSGVGDGNILFSYRGESPVEILPGRTQRSFTSSCTGSSVDRGLIYLSAERCGPRIIQDEFSPVGYDLFNVGVRGEYVAQILLEHDRHLVRDELLPVGEGDVRLLPAVVEKYMSIIFGPLQIQSRSNGIAPPSLFFKRPGLEEEWTLSSHTGFGLSYALPIVVAGLLAKPGTSLVVDSPEAHLHPAAQTAIAMFLCRVAGSGVNVIVETHSDYVVDGVRISVGAGSVLQAEDCVVLNFGRHDGKVVAESVVVDDAGKVKNWPAGFFDQHVINMRSLVGARQGNRG